MKRKNAAGRRAQAAGSSSTATSCGPLQETPTSLRNRVKYLKEVYTRVSAGQARPVGRQPAAGRVDRQEVPQPRPVVPRPDSGRQRRPDAGGRQVRISPRLQVLHLRHVVDSPGDHPGRGRPEPHDSHSGPHGRNHEPRAQRLAAAAAAAGPRADDRRNGPRGRTARSTKPAACWR